METIRIGIVGAGGIVRDRHIPGLRKIAGVELAAVCNRSRQSSEKAAREFDIPRVFDSWQDLVRSPEIDAVWIGTWPYLHCPIALEALAAGKHVFSQARMAMNTEEARRMLEAARRSDRVTVICPPPMGLKGDLQIQWLISQQGCLGEVYSIHLRAMAGQFLDPQALLTWRQREDLSGVNTLTVGIYAEVVHRWFGYAKSVTAQAKTFIAERPDEAGILQPVTRPDVVLVLGEMESGALFRGEWSGLAAPKPETLLEAYGSRGALRYHFDTDEIYISSDQRSWQKIEIPPERTREWTVEADFIDAIRTGKEVHPNFFDGSKYMEFTEAVFASVEQKRLICLVNYISPHK